MDSTNGVTGTVEREAASPHHERVSSTGTSAAPRTEMRRQPRSTPETRDVPLHTSAKMRATGTQDWYSYALGAVVVLGFFVLTVLLILRETSINEGHKDIVFMLFGGLVTGFSMVLSYFFGSSAGSAQKTVELAKIAKSR